MARSKSFYQITILAFFAALLAIGFYTLEANAETSSPPNKVASQASQSQPDAQKISEINQDLSKTNQRVNLLEVDHQHMKDAGLFELNERLSILNKDIQEESSKLFSTNATLLSICIGMTSLLITAVGITFVIAAFFGVKGIREFKHEVRTDLIAANEQAIAKVSEVIVSNQLSSFRSELEEEILELKETLDKLNLMGLQKLNGEQGVQDTPPLTPSPAPVTKQNAFE